MPIGNIVVYNSGDLILHTVSSSGTTFKENNIRAATSSIVLFDSNGQLNSQSLSTLTVGTASFIASSSNAFIQGGNSFGTIATLGTNDSQSLAFETSNTTRLTISSSGNVGIGITAPLYNLDVSGGPVRFLSASILYPATISDHQFISSSSRPVRYYPNLIGYSSNDNVSGSLILHTKIPRTRNEMFRFDVKGYNYGRAAIIDYTIIGYIYSLGAASEDGTSGSVISFSLIDRGDDYQPKYVGVDEHDNLAIAYGSSSAIYYFNKFSVDFYQFNNGTLTDINGWYIDTTTSSLSASGWKDQRVLTPRIALFRNAGVTIGDGYIYNFTPPTDGLLVEGNVGIGVTSATSKVHIRDDDSNATIIIENRGSTNDPFIRFIPTASNLSFALGIDDSDLDKFKISYGANNTAVLGTNDYLTISSSGDIGIGTNSPVSKLHINASGGDWIRLTSGSTDWRFREEGGRLKISSGSTDIISLRSTGNIGISTTNPVNKLDVVGNISASVITASLFFGTSSWSTNSLTASSLIITNNYQINHLTASTISASAITASAFFGTSSWALNTLSSSISTTASFANTASSLVIINNYQINNLTASIISASTLIGSHTGSTFGTASWANSASFVSPNGNAYVLGGNSFGQNAMLGLNDNFRLDIETNGSTLISLTGSNVGIGTTNPSSLLHLSSSTASTLLSIQGAGGSSIVNVSGSGNIGIGTSPIGTYRLQISGSFAATTKSFVIDHPTKPNKKLVYGSLESPYHGIRLTGKQKTVNGEATITLPDYISKFVREESINIQLTPIKCNKVLYVDFIDLKNNKFIIKYKKAKNSKNESFEFFWDFTAIRNDVEQLKTEI